MTAFAAKTEEFVFLMDAPDIEADKLKKQFVLYQDHILKVARQYDSIDGGCAIWLWMTWSAGTDAKGRRFFDPSLSRLSRIPDPMFAPYTHRYDLRLTNGAVESFVIYNDVVGNTERVVSWLSSKSLNTGTVSVDQTSVSHCHSCDGVIYLDRVLIAGWQSEFTFGAAVQDMEEGGRSTPSAVCGGSGKSNYERPREENTYEIPPRD